MPFHPKTRDSEERMRRLSSLERLKVILVLATLVALCLAASGGVRSSARAGKQAPAQATPTPAPSPAPAEAPKVEGCLSCHAGSEPMHNTRDGRLKEDGTDRVNLTCTACHGGNPFPKIEGRLRRGDAEFDRAMKAAHVAPRYPERWAGRDGKYSSANPERTNALLAAESREFVRFVNPGDFRVAELTCASTGCHSPEVAAARNSMMRHGGMLWGAALYNNGGYPIKDTRFGESYSEEKGAPEVMIQQPRPSMADTRELGIMPFIQPLPRWEISQPGNVLRVFERGGKRRLEVGLPDREDRKSTRLNSSHANISYAVFCLKK